MAKSKAQLEKRKREAEKRKKTEKIILKMAAAMPDDKVGPEATPPGGGAKTTPDKA